jgi:serine/threonine protein kinase
MDLPPDKTTESILGLDPRALLARGRTPRHSSARVPWEPPAVEELAPLLPSFALEEYIGRGGMGAVYRARQPGLDRRVAIKLLPRTAAEDAEFAERFRTEARALAKLQHPHIVTIHEAGETSDGHLYYAMEYVDGSDLSALLSHGPLPAAQALSIARAVCAALEYAHSRGIIHRDIKPANVLLGDDGTVKVADFGLAKLATKPADQSDRTGRTDRSAGLTLTGAALGTPTYMSPEQRAGQPVDARADLYSLGVMLYEMLTGDLPHGAWQPPSEKVASSPRLDAVVEQAVQRDPVRRVQSAAEFRTRLEGIGRSMAPGARRRQRRVFALGAATLLALAAGGVWWWQSRIPAQTAGGDSPAAASGGTPDYHYPANPPGTYRPLENLNMRQAVLNGIWSWQDDEPGGTLLIAYTHDKPSPKTLHLPVRPWPHGWNLTCEVLLEHKGADLTLLLPAGSTRPALVLDLYDRSGLEYIRGAGWNTNATTLSEPLPTGRFLPLRIEVRPDDALVSIKAELAGRPLLQWEGPQSDLYLMPENYSPELVNSRGTVLSLMSVCGGAQIRALVVEVLP